MSRIHIDGTDDSPSTKPHKKRSTKNKIVFLDVIIVISCERLISLYIRQKSKYLVKNVGTIVKTTAYSQPVTASFTAPPFVAISFN